MGKTIRRARTIAHRVGRPLVSGRKAVWGQAGTQAQCVRFYSTSFPPWLVVPPNTKSPAAGVTSLTDRGLAVPALVLLQNFEEVDAVGFQLSVAYAG